MNNENVRQAMATIGESVSSEKKIFLKRRLESADDKKIDELMTLDLYNPTHILLFSVFLGSLGIDRFLIKDTGLGVAKLLFGWATCGIWPLIDIFISYKKAKDKNLNKILEIL